MTTRGQHRPDGMAGLVNILQAARIGEGLGYVADQIIIDHVESGMIPRNVS